MRIRIRYWLLALAAVAVTVTLVNQDDHQPEPAEQLSFLEYCEQQKLECTESIEFSQDSVVYSREVRFTSWKYESDDGVTNISIGRSLHVNKTNEGSTRYSVGPALSWSWDAGKAARNFRLKERAASTPHQ